MAFARAFFVLTVVAGCAHQRAPGETGRGLERSIFPIYVGAGDRSIGGARVSDGAYRACSAVYVAPHLLATSAAAFPREVAERSVVDASAIAVLDGDFPLHVTSVRVDDAGGLAFVSTAERGIALEAPVESARTAKLKRYAFRFFPRAPGTFADAAWSVAPARLAPDAMTVETPLHAGTCGAALVDASGHLAGIVVGGAGGRGVVIGADAIQRARERLP